MKKDEIYKYLFKKLHKGKEVKNYEWEFDQFKKQLEANPFCNAVIEDTCRQHVGIGSCKHFQKILDQGGTDYEVALRDFVRSHKNISIGAEKYEMTYEFVLHYILYICKNQINTKDHSKLLVKIIEQHDLVNTLKQHYNELFSMFKYNTPQGLDAIIEGQKKFAIIGGKLFSGYTFTYSRN